MWLPWLQDPKMHRHKIKIQDMWKGALLLTMAARSERNGPLPTEWGWILICHMALHKPKKLVDATGGKMQDIPAGRVQPLPSLARSDTLVDSRIIYATMVAPRLTAKLWWKKQRSQTCSLAQGETSKEGCTLFSEKDQAEMRRPKILATSASSMRRWERSWKWCVQLAKSSLTRWWDSNMQARQPKEPLLVGNQYTQGVQEKAEAPANAFSKASQSWHIPKEVSWYKAEEKQNLKCLWWTIQLLSMVTSPWRSWRWLSVVKDQPVWPQGRAYLLSHDVPVHWVNDEDTPQILPDKQGLWTGLFHLEALVIAILKDWKPRHLPTIYRPLALTPH